MNKVSRESVDLIEGDFQVDALEAVVEHILSDPVRVFVWKPLKLLHSLIFYYISPTIREQVAHYLLVYFSEILKTRCCYIS